MCLFEAQHSPHRRYRDYNDRLRRKESREAKNSCHGLVDAVVLFGVVTTWIEICADCCKNYEGDELAELVDTLEDQIGSEADIKNCDLEPS